MRLLLLLFFATPVIAVEPEADCSTGGSGLYEQSICRDQKLAELRQKLEQHLSPTEVGDFDMSAVRVCQGAWKPTRQVLIYPMKVRSCLQNLMEGLLEEIESATQAPQIVSEQT